MPRITLDFGIDLGTTNSAIAVWSETEPRVIPLDQNERSIASAVWIPRGGGVQVGKNARERAATDPLNAHARFKPYMGERRSFEFAHGQVKMTSTQLSAEVLKKLTSVAARVTGEHIDAAVVTVPAAFNSPQKEATLQAASIAGIDQVELLQEPIAAAMAYSKTTRTERGTCLIYDWGGGTFDAALLQLQDRTWRVINHLGDNQLGGGDVDRAILESLIIPELESEFDLPSDLKTLEAHLLLGAEESKIALSDSISHDLQIVTKELDRSGRQIQSEVTLYQADVAKLALPYIRRTIGICRTLLEESNVPARNVDRVILVGGPTMAPYVREALSDSREGLGIGLYCEMDPITIVALGAATYASTQRRSTKATVTRDSVGATLTLEYDPVGPDSNAPIAGRIQIPGVDSYAGFSIIVDNPLAEPAWTSGRVPIATDGSFITTIHASRETTNNYAITLLDGAGRPIPVEPNSFSYRVGEVLAYKPLAATLALAMANNETDELVQKGTHLPAWNKKTHRTVSLVRAGDPSAVIRFVIVEGENKKADRNELVHEFSITGDKLSRDLPAGSDVEVLFQIDKSEVLTLDVVIPLTGDQFQSKRDKDSRYRDEPVATTKRRISDERAALEALVAFKDRTNDARALRKLHELEEQRFVEELDALAERMDSDEASFARAKHLVKSLMTVVDQLQRQMRFPMLEDQTERWREWAGHLVAEKGSDTEKADLAALSREVESARESGDADTFEHKLEDLKRLTMGVWWRQGEAWVEYFEYLVDRQASMLDLDRATETIRSGQMAIERGSLPQLQQACRDLLALFPDDQRGAIEGAYRATTVRAR